MVQRCRRFGVLGLALGVLVGIFACSSPATLESRSMQNTPEVNGVLDEWGGSLPYVKDQPVSLSAAPTDSLLYVAVSIQDRRLIRAIATKGLVVWVDPAGGQARTFGIRYPLGLRGQQGTRPATDGSDSPSRASAPGGSGFDQVSLSELEVLRNDSTRARIPAHFLSGLRAKATLNPGSLVYELAVPVSGGGRERRHGLRTPLDGAIGIGLMTPESDESNVTLPDEPMPLLTGRGGRRTPRRGRRGRRRQREAGPSSSPTDLPSLDLWTTVVVKDTGDPTRGN